MNYSLFDRVNDGPLTGPRWLHHCVKLMLSASVTGLCIAILGLSHVLLAGVIGGPVTFLIAKQGFYPWTDFAFTPSHLGDILTDSALALVSLAGAYLAIREYWHAGVLFGWCVIAYTLCHREARP